MYEHYITAFRNGITDISIDIDESDFWSTDENGDVDPNKNAVTVTVTFAVTTKSEGWLTIDSDGLVKPAFGGTGRTKPELDRYAEQAVTIWRAITGDTETTCRYKLRDGDERNQEADEHIISA